MAIAKAELERSRIALRDEVASARGTFERLVSKREIVGAWDDHIWIYKGRNYFLSRLKRRSRSEERLAYKSTREAIPGELGQILRCYVISLIAGGASTELLVGRLLVARIAVLVLGEELSRWSVLSRIDMDLVMEELVSSYKNENTRYHRCNDLRAFHRYLLLVKTLKGSSIRALLNNRVPWTHGLENPAFSLEFKKLERVDERGDKFPAGLEIAIGKLRKKLLESPGLELKPGCDSIRLNLLAFCFSLGLRVGELTRLPLDACARDAMSGATIVRCWTEKGAAPMARPVPNVWAASIQEASEYLLTACEDARQRAKDIEEGGFEFITSVVERAGPLPNDVQYEMAVMGMSAEGLCLKETILDNFDVTPKSFLAGGRYESHLVLRPSLMAVRLVVYLQKLILLLKASVSAKESFGELVAEDGRIPASRVGDAVGLCQGNVKNVPWVKALIRELSHRLGMLSASEVKGDGSAQDIRQALIEWLQAEIETLKERRSRNRGTLINYKTFIDHLSAEYADILRIHYKENCDSATLVAGEFRYEISSSSFHESLPLSRHLVVVWQSQFDSTSRYNGILPRPVLRSDIYNYLAEEGTKKTVFENYDIRDSSGRLYSFSPHQIRHWVTTALLRSGPNEMMVDLWMGRTPGHLRHYDHRTPKERAEYLRERGRYSSPTPPADWLGRKIGQLRKSEFSPDEIEHFIEEKLSLLHFTPWGYCSRDLTVMPCSKGLMCLKGFGGDSACSNFHIDPTDKVAKENIRKLHSSYKSMLIALEPRYKSMREEFLDSMNSSEKLDQHLIHLLRVVKGCEAALEAYESAAASHSKTPIRLAGASSDAGI